MPVHCMTRGFLPNIPENTQLTSSLQAAEMPGEAILSLSLSLSFFFFLMLVRSAGQIILGLWPEIF